MAALLSACGEEFSVATVAYLPSPPLPREMLTVTMNDPWRSHTLNGSQIDPPGQASAEYPTGEFGPLRFAFRFANGAVVASEGELEVQLGKNVRYDFVIQVAPANPTTACVDCGKAIGFCAGSRIPHLGRRFRLGSLGPVLHRLFGALTTTLPRRRGSLRRGWRCSPE